MRGTEQRPVRDGRPSAGVLTRAVTVVEQNVFVILVLATCGMLQTVIVRSSIGSDSWYTLLAGRLIARSGLPHHDTLTAIAEGRAWTDQNWLGQLTGYGLWRAGGWPLALAAGGACFLVAFALAAVASRLGGASERSTVLVLAVCLVAGLPNTVFRSQLPAYVLFALVLLLLLRDERQSPGRVYLVFPLLILWANIHGSIVVGAGLVVLHGAVFAVSRLRERAPAGDWLPRAAVLLIAPWACVFATPYAFGMPGYYRTFLWNPDFSRFVSEWGPSTARSQPVFFALLLTALWLASRSRALTPFAQLALLGTGVAGLLAIRSVIWFALVSAAVLPLALDRIWPPANHPRHRRLNVGLAVAGAAGLVACVATMAAHPRSWFERDYPSEVAEAVGAAAARNPRLEVFASDRYADWLLFENPQLAGRVAFDVRYELLRAGELRRIIDFLRQKGPDWQRGGQPYGLLVLDKSQGPPARSVGGAHPDILATGHDVIVVRRMETSTP